MGVNLSSFCLHKFYFSKGLEGIFKNNEQRGNETMEQDDDKEGRNESQKGKNLHCSPIIMSFQKRIFSPSYLCFCSHQLLPSYTAIIRIAKQ
jgi:hypothetical protein